MKNKIKRITAIFIVTALTLLCIGCGSKNSNVYVESKTYGVMPVYKFTLDGKGEDVFPVLGFVGPHTGLARNGCWIESINKEETYKTISEAGCNIIQSFMDYDVVPEEVEKALGYAEKYGIKIMCYDTSLWSVQGKNVASVETIKQKLQKISEYKSFLGFCGDDEPFSVDMQDCYTANSRYFQAYNELGLNNQIIYTSCLNPKWAYVKYDENFATQTYAEYVQSYVDNVHPKHLSYDFYPFVGVEKEDENTVKEGYFENLAEMRELANKNKLPYWSYIQVCTYDPESVREPSEGEIWWNFNTSLAFGVKGFGLYSLCEPNEYSTTHTSMIGLFGEKRSSYYFVKSAMKQVSAVQSTLINSYNYGVMVCGESIDTIPKSVTLDKFRQLKSVKGDNCIVGCFDYNGKTALYVVNNSLVKDKASVTLNFDNNYGYEVTQRGIKRQTNGKSLTLKLAEGEGALIVLK